MGFELVDNPVDKFMSFVLLVPAVFDVKDEQHSFFRSCQTHRRKSRVWSVLALLLAKLGVGEQFAHCFRRARRDWYSAPGRSVGAIGTPVLAMVRWAVGVVVEIGIE